MKLLFLLLFSLLFGRDLKAESIPYIIDLHVKDYVEVKDPEVRLEVVANFHSRDDSPTTTSSIKELKELVIIEHLPPDGLIKISGEDILHRLRFYDVNFAKVAYVIPRELTVKRRARIVDQKEALEALQEHLRAKNLDLAPRVVKFIGNNAIGINDGPLIVTKFSEPSKGEMLVSFAGGSVANPSVIQGVALVDEFREVPVARRALTRGDLIDSDDLVRARLNLHDLPQGTILDEVEVVGKEVKNSISAYAPFRQIALMSPPLIKRGEKIKLLYQTKFLEASAIGIALKDGALNEVIEARNSKSFRVVQGKVVASGSLQVGP
jgi:flagella basal body P-ring formation protein FlgA